MLAVVAAALFALAFLLNAAGVTVPAVVSPTNLLLLGLACLALHQAGFGPAQVGTRRTSGFRRR
jgi:hypothetical protein